MMNSLFGGEEGALPKSDTKVIRGGNINVTVIKSNGEGGLSKYDGERRMVKHTNQVICSGRIICWKREIINSCPF